MKNTILKFENEELDEFIVSNYFSKNIDLFKLLNEVDLDEYITTYKLDDDDKLERVSHELYKTTDLWDVILTLNGSDPLFDMPTKFDNIFDSVQEFIDHYTYNVFFQPPLNFDRSSELVKNFIEENQSINDIKRYIVVIKPSKITDFILLLKDKGYL